MRLLQTALEGPLLIEPEVHGDERGFLVETYREGALAALGLDRRFVQDNHSRSQLGVVRGMHLQVGEGQAKLVRCARGAIVDVLVDVRAGSPSYGRWEAYVLDDVHLRLLYAPVGFAHGFCVTTDVADVLYKTSSYYDPSLERGFAYDDPDVGIRWPDGIELAASARDSAAPRLADIAVELPFSHGG